MIRDYDILLSILEPHQLTTGNLLSLFVLCLCRILPILAMAPFMGAKVLPRPVKMGMGIAFFTILLPKLLVTMNAPQVFGSKLLILAFKEILIGFFLGMFSYFPFWVAEISGMYIDHQRGGAALNVQDPTTQTQSSPIGTMYNLSFIYIFFLINGPFLFFDAIIYSYDVVGPDQFLSELFFRHGSPFWDTVIELFGKTVITGIRFASPALLVILMTDMFLGIINRMAPQVMITFLGMPLKSLLGLGVVCLGWKLYIQSLAKQAIVWFTSLKEVMMGLGIGT